MQLDAFAGPDSASGKMCQEPSHQTKEETLLSWLATWLGHDYVYRETDGKQPELLSEKMDSVSGPCWTRSGLEWRSGAVACLLSSILETGPVDPRFFLSAKACQGILRRAEKRGKVLPVLLRVALEDTATGAVHSEQMEAILGRARKP